MRGTIQIRENFLNGTNRVKMKWGQKKFLYQFLYLVLLCDNSICIMELIMVSQHISVQICHHWCWCSIKPFPHGSSDIVLTSQAAFITWSERCWNIVQTPPTHSNDADLHSVLLQCWWGNLFNFVGLNVQSCYWTVNSTFYSVHGSTYQSAYASAVKTIGCS